VRQSDITSEKHRCGLCILRRPLVRSPGALVQGEQTPLGSAERLREAFKARLSVLRTPSPSSRSPGTDTAPQSVEPAASALAFPKAVRLRDREHLRHVAKQPCVICGRQPSDPHHLRFAQSKGMGQKVSDEFALPLCRAHHREVHRASQEAARWRDPHVIARALWLKTRPDGHLLAP
jgi:hypothetical protein